MTILSASLQHCEQKNGKFILPIKRIKIINNEQEFAGYVLEKMI